ncbi:MAG: SEC-C domain-containing protein, partial [Rhizobiaceae bacterium]|nr:SEC-C domain-containing protein [Rhizobiaceae bacterium]
VDTLGEIMGVESGSPRERLYSALEHGIPHNILNAKYHEQEARIVTEAGRKGQITIATNMAGRGVDIILGGTHYKDEGVEGAVVDMSFRRGRQRGPMSIAHVVGKNDAAADPETLGPAGAGTISLNEEAELPHDIAKEREEVKALGGLYILGTERHESRRIDNQLRGRSGRQGDPGRSKFFLSLQDDLMRIFGSERMDTMLTRLGLKEDEAIVHPWINKALEKAQKKVEARNFDIRKNLLKYDDVMNDQRRVIFEQRLELMDADGLTETVTDMRHSTVETLVARHIPERAYPEQWSTAELKEETLELLNLDLPVPEWADEEGIDDNDIRERMLNASDGYYAAKAERFGPDVMTYVERSVVLQTIDSLWREHLVNLDHLRSVVGFRGYAQRDPLNEYKSEGFELFQTMLGNLRERTTAQLMRVEIVRPEEKGMPDILSNAEGHHIDASTGEDEFGQVRDDGQDPNLWGPVGRNEPCPCGSGKKFKHCHGAYA